MDQPQTQVECHSEYQYAERPTAFFWNGERIVVSEVIAHWRSPKGMHFRVSTQSQGIFELSYIELEGTWVIQQP